MLRRIVTITMLAVLVVMAFATLAAAQDVEQYGPYNPQIPSDEFTAIAPGEVDWYAFTFDSDADMTDALSILLFSEPLYSTELLLLNGQQVEQWINDGEINHFGCCTKVYDFRHEEDFEAFTMWSGLPDVSGTYYLMVKPADYLTEPVSYRFEMTGSNFTMLGEEMAPAADIVDEPAMAVMPEETAVEVTGLMGSSPFFAMAPADAWTILPPGEQHWYAFDYDFDADWVHDPSIMLEASDLDAVQLTLHNGEQAHLWEIGEELEHFGCCTAETVDAEGDSIIPAFATWAGSLGPSGRYYIVVEAPENGTDTLYYRFKLSGDGIQ